MVLLGISFSALGKPVEITGNVGVRFLALFADLADQNSGFGTSFTTPAGVVS
jgi:hypothetical protein